MKKSIALVFLLFFFLTNLASVPVHAETPMSNDLRAGEIPDASVLTLDQCVTITLKKNATLIAAENSYKVTRSNVWTAWGNFLPRLDTDVGYYRTVEGPKSTPGFSYNEATGKYSIGYPGINSYDYYSAGARATQSLSLGGYEFYDLWDKKAQMNSALKSLRLSQQEIVLLVKQSYFDVLKAKMLLEIQKDALKRAEKQLNIAQTRYELGSASLSDVLKAKVQHGNAELALISAKNNVELAKAQLNNQMGQDVNAPIDVEEVFARSEFTYSYEAALQEALGKNPSVRKAQYDLNSAKSQFGMARSGLFPGINLYAQYSWSNADFDEIKYIRRRDYQWNFGAYISFNIFENFQTKHNVSWTKANLNSARENYRQAQSDVALEVKQAILGIQEAQEKLDLTAEKVKSAKEDLDLVQEKYNLGAANILELLDAEVSYKEAESDQVQALYDYNMAIAQFEKAIGK
jgi:outer membrane protein